MTTNRIPRLEDFPGPWPDDFLERVRRDAESLRAERTQTDAEDRDGVVQSREAFLAHAERDRP